MAVIILEDEPLQEIQGWSADGTILKVSKPAGPTDSVRLTSLPYWLPHVFLSIKTYSDAAGTAEATDTTGVFTVTVKTINSMAYEAITDGPTITAATPTTSSWDGNTDGVNVAVTTPLTSTVTWRAFLTFNR